MIRIGNGYDVPRSVEVRLILVGSVESTARRVRQMIRIGNDCDVPRSIGGRLILFGSVEGTARGAD